MAYKKYDTDFAEDVISEMLDLLSAGHSMSEICASPRMPDAATFWRWSKRDDELARDIARAREIGYFTRAEKAVLEAKTAADPAKGRLAFDAERWYLGKLSNAFSDDKKRELKVEHSMSPEAARWLGLS